MSRRHGRLSGLRHKLRPSFEAAEQRVLLSTIMVTTNADSGPGSFRQAILDADQNSTPTTINFSIGRGLQSIALNSELPVINSTMNIDATTQPGYAGTPLIELNGTYVLTPGSKPPVAQPNAYGLEITAGGSSVRGIAINRFTGPGILIQGGGNSTITNDCIGTNPLGTLIVGNGGDGIRIVDSPGNTIGGITSGNANIISGNSGSGVSISSSNSQGGPGRNVIEGNRIGTDFSGMLDLGNIFSGVLLTTSNNVVGGSTPAAGNLISNNGSDGIRVGNGYYYNGSYRNAFLSNSIYTNNGYGINLGYNGVSPISAAQITSAYIQNNSTVISGYVQANALAPYSLQFFTNPVPSNGFVQGQTLIGHTAVTTDVSGLARFSVTIAGALPLSDVVTAIVTDVYNTSSSFLAEARIGAAPSANLYITQDNGSGVPIAGAPLVFTLRYVNNGPSTATSIVVTDPFPTSVQVVSARSSLGITTVTNGVVKVTLPTLYYGETETTSITVIPTLASTITNTATISADQPDPDLSDNSSTLATVISYNLVAPVVVAQHLFVGLHSINGLVLTVSEPLDPAQAVNSINYQLLQRDKYGKFSINVPMKPVVYDPLSLTLLIMPKQPLKLGISYELIMNGKGSAGVSDPAGNLLVGNTSFGEQGPFVVPTSRGYFPNRPYANATGAEVKLVQKILASHKLK